ncbi:MAG: PadR family transcriptional regulator [Cellvibrionales bacterium]|nr:PadR family transcriptional regulator [Cellvibrionales bacterium]
MTKQKPTPDLLDPVYWNNTIKMSLSKFFILCVLTKRPMHGYDIAKAVESQTNGCCSPAEGTIYPVLKQFETGGYVECEKELVGGRERKVYSITDKGREAFNIALTEWNKITQCLMGCQPIEMKNEEGCC